MQSPQNRGPEQPSPGFGQPSGYGQQSGYNQPAPYGQQAGYGNSPIPSATGGYGAPRMGEARVLKKINPGSAFKVGAMVYGLLWAILGLLYVPLFGAMIAAMPQRSGAAAIGGSVGIMLYFFGIIGSAISGGIGAAVSAFIYNAVAGWVGGLEIEVS